MTSLLSPTSLGIALAAIIALPLLRGAARQAAFLALNLVFVAGVVLEPVGAAGTLAFVALGYALATLARNGRRELVIGVVVLAALFVYMRHYVFLDWLLPESWLTVVLSTVGLSFLFFKIVHVMVDAYSGVLGRLDPATYLNYCLNFTTFLMGPIQRYQDYRTQWEGDPDKPAPDFEHHLGSVLRVLVGLVKASVIAPWFDSRALQPDTPLAELSLAGLVVKTYAFWFFLYFNFSGYCDAVIGVGNLMGITPPENFNRPYLARNASDFWQRQHRSLTLWLTDYVFNPLYATLLSWPVTPRSRLLAANVSLMITMLVSGLWHGTTLAFLCFGLLHGLWLVIYRTWDELLVRRLGRAAVRRLRERRLSNIVGVVLTFNATAFAFIFFQVRWERIIEALSWLVSS